ncbi:IclR family transcriptional regulator [Jatrophihabitans sp. DSM 45814]
MTSASSPRRNDAYVSSVLKAVQVVETLAEHDGDVSLSDLARHTGQPVASTYRLLSTLEHAGWTLHGSSGGYRLSLRLAQIAGGVLSGVSLRTVAQPIMRQLTATTAETSYLALRDDDRVVCLERIESKNLVRLMTWDVGKSLPLDRGGAALAILANLPPAEAKRVAQAHEPGTGRDVLAPERLDGIRSDGYALSVEEVTPGVASVGAAIFNAEGEVIAALSVGGLAPAIRGRITDIGTAVRHAAHQVSRAIGYNGEYPPTPHRAKRTDGPLAHDV